MLNEMQTRIPPHTQDLVGVRLSYVWQQKTLFGGFAPLEPGDAKRHLQICLAIIPYPLISTHTSLFGSRVRFYVTIRVMNLLMINFSRRQLGDTSTPLSLTHLWTSPNLESSALDQCACIVNKHLSRLTSGLLVLVNYSWLLPEQNWHLFWCEAVWGEIWER